MKAKEREEARRLRSEEGLSVGEIARRLGVSKGTSSLWLRDIELTDEQKLNLIERGRTSANQLNGSKRIKEKAKEQREAYQKAGRDFVREGKTDEGYRMLCALYWAEGNKSRNEVGMTNTDVAMLKIFVDGMKRYFGRKDEDFTVRVNAHLGNGLIVEQIQDYWLKELGLPKPCLRAFILKSKYYPIQNKKHKRHVYGGCSVRVCSSEIMQKIYGSIQEIFGIERPEWLWG
jgi:transcriptional regulator with XRE-family HTH domain